MTAKPFTVTIEGLDKLKQYPQLLEERFDRALQEATQKTAQELRDSLESAIGRWRGNVGWSGYLYNSIEAKKIENGGWGIRMLDYGKELDSMSSHYEVLKKGRKITTWAKAHGIPTTTPDNEPRTIRVHKHPFIERGIYNFNNNIQTAIRQYK
jgi:hypothetical protein